MSDFNHLVWQALKQVPAGQVTTYGALAKAAGHPSAARAVGNALNKNPYDFTSKAPRHLLVPCHRVVMSDGRLGGFALGTIAKIALLAQEGVLVKDGRVADFCKLKM